MWSHGVVFCPYVVVNDELRVVYLVVVLNLSVVGGRGSVAFNFVGRSLKWE
jgi:branched-subunit amino acid ABC-type transport system permease component